MGECGTPRRTALGSPKPRMAGGSILLPGNRWTSPAGTEAKGREEFADGRGY